MRLAGAFLWLTLVACSNDSAVDTAKAGGPPSEAKDVTKQVAQPKPLITNFDTPQAVYDAVKRAKADDDVERALSLMTEEGWAATIPNTLYSIAFVGQHLGQGGEELKSLDALVKSHGLSGLDSIRLAQGGNFDAYIQSELPKVADKRAFLLAFNNWASKYVSGTKKKKKKQEEVLEDLVVTGDTATARAVIHLSDRGTQSRELSFKRIDGQWKISSQVIF